MYILHICTLYKECNVY